MAFWWVTTLHHWVIVPQCFEGTAVFIYKRNSWKISTVRRFETSESDYPVTPRQVPGELHSRKERRVGKCELAQLTVFCGGGDKVRV
jgi:hypothetical protein